MLRQTAANAGREYLNLGCGTRYHPAWTNVDFFAADGNVLTCDLRDPFPFGDATFDVVYHSHVLEHFTPEVAQRFMNECSRVLRPGGIVRIAVPDLEQIVRQYLASLERVKIGDLSAESDYDWMMTELCDQMVRNTNGGQMAKYLQQQSVPNMAFVLSRLGKEAAKIIDRQASAASTRNKARSVGTIVRQFLNPRRIAARATRIGLRCLLGPNIVAYDLGEFRLSGEVHLWMYDQYSLGRLLRRSGFAAISRASAQESQIQGWRTFNLDTEPDGTVYKHD